MQLQKYGRGAGSLFGKVAAGVAASLAAVGSAMAGVAADAVTAIDGAKADVGLVQTAVIGVLVLLVIFLFIKRSMK